MLLLAACSSPEAPAASTAPPPPATTSVTATAAEPTATPTPTPTPTPTCSTLTGAEAFAQSIGEVPYPSGYNNWEWAEFEADTTYDPCAELSWIVVTHPMGTASTPCHIMLFHAGEYLGTATSEAYGFYPAVVRLDDATLQVTYTYLQPDDASNAEASGRAVVTLTWNSATQQVDFEGEVPPT